MSKMIEENKEDRKVEVNFLSCSSEDEFGN
jgi:hypothetical protein